MSGAVLQRPTSIRPAFEQDPMSFNNSQSLAEQLLELALRSGAEAAEVFQSGSMSRPVFFEANRLKQLESSQAEGVALRALAAGSSRLSRRLRSG